jgi:hypothetical protein
MEPKAGNRVVRAAGAIGFIAAALRQAGRPYPVVGPFAHL